MEHAQSRLDLSLPTHNRANVRANTLAAEWYGEPPRQTRATPLGAAQQDRPPCPADHYSRSGAYLGHPERKHSAYGLVLTPAKRPEEQAAPSREEKTIRGVLPD